MVIEEYKIPDEEQRVLDLDAKLGWSTRQNVHNDGVIKSATRILRNEEQTS